MTVTVGVAPAGDGVVDLGSRGRDKFYGNGLVQARDADQYLSDHACLGN